MFYLDEDVDAGQGKKHQAGVGRSQQHDDADFQQLEQVTQHHLQTLRDHAVNGVYLFGEAVQEVPAWRDLKKGHW